MSDLDKLVLSDESIDDLQLKGLKLIQKKDAFRFGVDAVLLSDFSRVKSKHRVIDLCSGTGNDIAAYAQKFIGNPYVYGGTSLTNGADCSGFVLSVYKSFGYSLPRTSSSQSTAGIRVDMGSLQPGDLVFPHADHVGIYVGDGKMIHSPKPGKSVEVIPMYGFWRARRILN